MQRILLLQTRKNESKKLKTFKKLLEQIVQVFQYNQNRKSQRSRGKVYQETEQELNISGNTGTIPINPSEETIFGSNKVKKQHGTMKLQNEEVMPTNI